tara:strand:- start:2627 stop:3010 length:384 start_codon:yes stop_codon:yes gene_type:complete
MGEFFQKVMFFLLTYPISALPVIGVLFVFWHYFKRTSFSVLKKRIIFGGVAIFCLYPTILPAGTIFGFIVPTLFLIVLSVIFLDLNGLVNLMFWHIKLFPSLAPFIFLVIFAVVSVTRKIFRDAEEE